MNSGYRPEKYRGIIVHFTGSLRIMKQNVTGIESVWPGDATGQYVAKARNVSLI